MQMFLSGVILNQRSKYNVSCPGKHTQSLQKMQECRKHHPALGSLALLAPRASPHPFWSRSWFPRSLQPLRKRAECTKHSWVGTWGLRGRLAARWITEMGASNASPTPCQTLLGRTEKCTGYCPHRPGGIAVI